MSPRTPKRKAGGRRVKEQVVETTSAALALGAQSGRLVVGAVVVAALLLVVGEIRTASSGDAPAPPSAQEVAQLAYGCPTFNHTGSASPTTVAVGTLPGAAVDGGSRTVVRLPGADPVAALADAPRGTWATAAAGQKTSSVLVNVVGAQAPGTVAYAASKATGADGGGLAVGACPRPAPERWFVGAGGSTERSTALVLTNTSTSPGVVDLTMYGGAGEVEGVGATGIVVDPGTSKTVRLAQLTAGEAELAVRVVVRRGAVAAAAVDVTRQGVSTPAGSEFLPSSALPATDVTVAGVPGDQSARTLLVANPSDRTATVALSIATKDGAFTPTGLETVDIAPQSVTPVRLPADISPRAYAVRLTSDVPVTASVRTTVGSDVAYSVAADAWEGTAVVPVQMGRALAPGSMRVIVTPGGEETSSVRVTAHAEDGTEVGNAELEAPGGTTTTVDPFGAGGVGVDVDDVAYLTLQTNGTVRAAAVYGTGGFAVTPLTAAPVREAAPVVRPVAP
ncbi:hypothetical protein FE697_015005 [Mumia zhuanghuii]|uniref:Large extracellular alpha-helical protein n=1 Tax=Mumia zhuanghuii TaxID=2585211 RepID=A0A5Q6RWK9_9ACTN|nr:MULTISPECIES: DUF5719 family protein [Mumia]KAA1422451.1 hypothetical protein FE697_015005 [Mumia zhuanghuii]